MKILKNDNTRIYVQLCDLLYLKKSGHNIIESVEQKVDFDIINKFNKHDLIFFQEIDEIDYFNNFNFILDHKYFNSMNIEELEELEVVAEEQIRTLKKDFNSSLTNEEQENLKLRKIKDLEYYLKNVRDIRLSKLNGVQLDLFEKPVTIISEYIEGIYSVSSTIDENIFIVSKTDDSAIDELDVIPENFYDRVLKHFGFSDSNYNYYFKNQMSEEKKKMIITLQIEQNINKKKTKSIFTKIFK